MNKIYPTEYIKFINLIEEFLKKLHFEYVSYLQCYAGCDDCCQYRLSLFPIEIFHLQNAFNKTSKKIQNLILNQSKSSSDSCVLLHNKKCLLYSSRPIICRTHGYPVLAKDENDKLNISYCPNNFQSIPKPFTFKGDSILNLDALNTRLVLLNQFFLQEHNLTNIPERLKLAEAFSEEVKLI